MAKKHISEDEIKYIVSAETAKAQQNIHALAKATKELRKEETSRRKAMVELEAQGKKETEEYRNLEKECKAYTKQISANNKKMDEMRKKLDVNAMSMVQLKRQAKDLRSQMDNMSKALNPTEYAELERQLQKVNDRMGDLKIGAKSLAEIAKSEGTIAVMFGTIFSKISELAGQSLARMKEFVLEGIDMAASADGVTRAFQRMDDGTILDNLRQATKGTVTDLDFMKAAVKAKDFRIPLDELGKYLAFAQLKAQQTGQSVDYMTESIVTGLGRKSLLILDNLGLSAAEINEEVSKTGDFMSAVASIVDKQLTEAGGNYVSATDRATQKTVQLQNEQRKLGEILLPIKEKYEDAYGFAQVSTMRLIGWIVQHRAAIGILITTIGTYVATQKIAVLWNKKHADSTLVSIAAEKLQALRLNLSRRAFLAKLIAMDLYHGRCNLATAATEMFNLVLKASPLGIVTTLAATAAAAFLLFGNKTSAADKSVSDLNKRLQIERAELGNIFSEMKKTNPGTTERSGLIEELNKKYPGLLKNYNLEQASLKEITRAQNEANVALTNRIATEMKAQTLSDYVKKNVSTQIDTEEQLMKTMESTMDPEVFNRLKKSLKSFFLDSTKSLDDFKKKFGTLSHFNEMSIGVQVGFINDLATLRDNQKSYSNGVDEINKKYDPYIKSLKTSASLSDEELKRQMEATSIIAKLEKQKEKVQNTWKEDTKENIALKNHELERLDTEIKKYKELGKVKPINYANKKAQEAAEKEKKAVIDTEKYAIQSLETLREEDLQNQQKWYNTSVYAFNSDLSEKLISNEQHELLMIELDKQNAENRLKIEQTYYQDAQSLQLTNSELKEDLVRKSGQRVLTAEKETNAARATEQAKLNDLIKDFKSQFKVTTVDEDHQAQMSVLKASYQARKEMAIKNNLDTTELDQAYYRAKEQLETEHQSKILAIRNQYGLSTQQERFNAELAQLKNAHDQLLLSEEEYEQAVQNLKRDSFKKQFDYYSNLFSGAVQALQQAEMDNVDAQYDAEIEAAKGNSEEVERLENEKAQKKLDIQKKYADINFAIKASQIIADTAVSIMKALADLGPIAGPIAASLMGVTGLAQLASAKAERDKVKNMTLSGSKSSSNTGARVATGRETGGKIDVRRAQDGKLFPNTDYDPDARGFIDKPTVIVGEGPSGRSREWVASNAAVSNPTIAPVLDILDRSQQAGTIRTLDLNQAIRARMAGFSSGGSISQPVPSSPNPISPDSGAALPPELMKRLANAIINIDENGLPPSSVSLTDFEAKQKLRDRSRNLAKK